MTAVGERVARSMREAFVTSWIALPPPSKFKNNNLSQCAMHGAFAMTLRASAFIWFCVTGEVSRALMRSPDWRLLTQSDK